MEGHDPRGYPDWLPIALLLAFIVFAGSVTLHLTRGDHTRMASENPTQTSSPPAAPADPPR